MTSYPKTTGCVSGYIGSGLYDPATNVTPNGKKHWPPSMREQEQNIWINCDLMNVVRNACFFLG